MSFDSLQIPYIPPPTIPSVLRSTPVPASAAVVIPILSTSGSLTQAPRASLAGKLILEFSDLSATAEYLQSAILSKLAGSGLSFTPAENPDLARALAAIYPGAPAPNGISVEMYANMLDAELALMQLQSAVGNDAAIEPSPQNIADLITTTKAFEKQMIQSLGYQNNLAPLLRSLKGDQAIQANMAEQCGAYPVIAGTTSTLISGLDVSLGVGILLENYVQTQSDIYARIFTLLSTPTDVEMDVLGVSSFFLSAGASEVAMMIATLISLKNMMHGVDLQDLADDMTNFVFVAMLSDVSFAMNEVDRLANLSVMPLKNSISSSGIMLQSVQALSSQVGFLTTGGLKGMVQGNSCSAPTNQDQSPSSTGNSSNIQISQAVNKTLGQISKGMNAVLTSLNHATNTINKKNDLIQESFRKLASRRSGDQGAMLELLCNLRNVESMLNLAQGIAMTLGSLSGSAVSGTTAISAASALQSVTQVISTMSSPTGSSFAIVNNAVIVTPPTLPPVSATVQAVFNRGGAGVVTARNLAFL